MFSRLANLGSNDAFKEALAVAQQATHHGLDLSTEA
jgi:hypothetical protein